MQIIIDRQGHRKYEKDMARSKLRRPLRDSVGNEIGFCIDKYSMKVPQDQQPAYWARIVYRGSNVDLKSLFTKVNFSEWNC